MSPRATRASRTRIPRRRSWPRRYRRKSAPAWIAFVNPGEISGLAGMCQFRLGQFRYAASSARQALSLLPSDLARNKYAITVQLARCRLAQRDIEQVTASAREALALRWTVQSPRWDVRFNELRKNLSGFMTNVATEFSEYYDLYATEYGLTVREKG